MISFDNKQFVISTDKTSYVFELLNTGHLRHLYYGNKDDVSFIKPGWDIGDTIAYDDNKKLFLESELLEVSTCGKGDIKEPFIELINPDGSLTSDFLYKSHSVDKCEIKLHNLPSPHGECEHLCIELKDYHFEIYLYLHFYVYEKEDVICRNAVLVNREKEDIVLQKLMSLQLDFENDDMIFTCFRGSWANEMHKTSSIINQIKLVNSSNVGSSSSRANPFVMISSKDANEDNGDVYGFNLVYSGNHYEAVDTIIQNRSRFVSGINPDRFEFEIKNKESFESPIAVMTYSDKGFNGMSSNMHDFINRHIVRGKYQYNRRPILINTWEAFYFDIEERKLLELARKAKDLGIELFVLDDGWFGGRNDATSSLGDWTCDKNKIPGGLRKLNEDIDMNFGIWVEPEMVNTDSDLYRKHPEWCVEYDHHSEGRNQRYLDLSNDELVDYLIEIMSSVFEESGCTYVKWDLNRIMSDLYSKKNKRQMEFVHRYYLGFYRLCETLNKRFPDILFEGCSGGGNRFDLGILCYFPQIWASDNTDAEVRRRMLYSYSYGYPVSCIGSHVSACPNHQTGRTFPLGYRYEVAKFGCLGYELDLNKLSEEELNMVKEQIKDFKENRDVLMYGRFYRTDEKHFKVSDGNKEISFDYNLINE
ncbi:MAG: alpha-galactosidase [Erysipelotrichaceae bacterium]|nr:alpha-galactosidase [Erysipelotrichaceae bacterium]